jgi:hypothetical protein
VFDAFKLQFIDYLYNTYSWFFIIFIDSQFFSYICWI